MGLIRYTRQRNGTFKKEGSATERKVKLRIFRRGEWKEPICPVSRTVLTNLLETEDSKYLPGQIYELIGIESEMTEETKGKLKDLTRKKKQERGEE